MKRLGDVKCLCLSCDVLTGQVDFGLFVLFLKATDEIRMDIPHDVIVLLCRHSLVPANLKRFV